MIISLTSVAIDSRETVPGMIICKTYPRFTVFEEVHRTRSTYVWQVPDGMGLCQAFVKWDVSLFKIGFTACSDGQVYLRFINDTRNF